MWPQDEIDLDEVKQDARPYHSHGDYFTTTIDCKEEIVGENRGLGQDLEE